MTAADLALQGIVALAASMQAITGIGFAMIAGPFILLALDDGSAVQVTSALSLLIAALLAPGLRARIDWRMFWRLCIGSMIGLPFGLVLFLVVDLDLLKLIAGLTVGLLTALIIFAPRHTGGGQRPESSADWAVAGISGFFGGCLAMPGPTAAARMNARNFDKTVTRATILAMFLFLYPIILVAHGIVIGGARDALMTSVGLAPGAIAGTLAGAFAASRVSERAFRNLVLVLLAATSATLLAAAGRGLSGG